MGDTNIQNNIILNNNRNEDLSHITDKLKTDFEYTNGAIPKMIEAILNDEKPENKNILLQIKRIVWLKFLKAIADL